MRRLALFMVLSAKAKENKLIVLDSLILEKPKTKLIAQMFQNLPIKKNSCLIGLGKEEKVINEEATVTDTDVDNIHTFSGFTANHPIKPGSFNWIANIGGVETEFFDNGDGTLGTSGFAMSSSVINYTSGFFSRSMQSAVEFQILWDRVDYTTYEFDVTPAGLATDNSGLLTGEFTVPAIWNETHTVTAIDETGNIATSDFTVFGSDVIPEALTIGAIVLLSSAALIVSFYCLRKRSKPERPA